MSANFEDHLWNPWLWPMMAAAWAGEAALSGFCQGMNPDGPLRSECPEPQWTTPNRVRLELPSLRVREFGDGAGGVPTLIVSPFALHGATMTDFAPHHSLVRQLLDSGSSRIFVLECRSATPAMRYFSVDTYLADFTVALQDLGTPANLIGLCQGGWLSLMLAARFPHWIRGLVLAGSPVDLDSAPSKMVACTRATAPEFFEGLVLSGGGRVLGRQMLNLWSEVPTGEAIADVLQTGQKASRRLFDRYRQWHEWTVDLPGPYYLQVVEQLFRRNELARGEFRALGRKAELGAIRTPLFLLAGRDDAVTPTAQLLAVRHLVGTPAAMVETTIAEGGHLSLFMGEHVLRHEWPRIAEWLQALG